MKKTMIGVAVAVAAMGAFAGRKVTMECDTLDIDAYRAYAQLAKELGATHLGACAVEPSMWQWDAAANRFDPYPNWSMHRPTLFKFVVPEALKPYLPEDYAARNMARLRARAAILKEFGLKAGFIGQEPAYLPEKAFRDHPNWRGPRCDQCRRARAEYYAPCTDDPEVRAFYAEAMEKLCREIPLESFDFMCNDSGAGLCWYPYLYPGCNGPGACRRKPVADRIVDFMSLLQEGAARAGVKDLRVNMNRYCREDLMQVVLPKLRKGQAVHNRTAAKAVATNIIGFPNPFAEQTYPIHSMPRMVEIVKQLQKAGRDPEGDVSITVRSLDEIDTIRLLKARWNGPRIEEGAQARYAVLHEIAATFVGEAEAENLVRVWDDIEQAYVIWNWAATGGHIFLLGTTHQRWLTRPLVCFPEELKPEEKDYYRGYQFQAGSEADADDLAMLQGHRWLGGYGASFAVRRSLTTSLPALDDAIDTTVALIPAAKDAESARYLKGLELKLRLYKAVAKNAAHAVDFQNYMDEGKGALAKAVAEKDFHAHPFDQGGRSFEMVNDIIRSEIGNTLKIVGLLERAQKLGVKIIRTADCDAYTNVMNLPPVDRLVRELKLKVEIMENHRRDVTRIYRSNNR